MSTAKHTPGPWEETYNTSDNTWGVCLPEGGDVLAQLMENQADAHLIAAAPAMYEAIKATLEHRVNDFLDNNIEPYLWLKQALAQAEGK